MKKLKLKLIMLSTALLLAGTTAYSAIAPDVEPEFIPTIDIQLSAPQTDGGMPLYEALKNRKTDRSISQQELDEQMLSNLLWAANGVNREDGKRTAPSAMNAQEISIFAVMPKGVYYYYPKGHFLKRIMKEDLRPIVGNVPLTLIYVGDLSRQSKTTAACDCGFIGQNVYLFAAANGLSTCFRGDINNIAVAEKLELKLGQEVLYGQSIGYKGEGKKSKRMK